MVDHLGPVNSYMASCNDDCTKFDATTGKWFKIQEDGYDSGVWATTKLIQSKLDLHCPVGWIWSDSHI